MSKEDKTYAEKRKEWLECLQGDDENSIKKQLIQMSWNIAVFETINQARRIIPFMEDNGKPKLNGMVHLLIDEGFAAAELLRIRRLVDTYSISGKRGVYSLTGLIKDMITYKDKITRENLFEAEGLDYDIEKVRQDHLDFLANEAKKHPGKGAWVSRSLDEQILEARHKEFDEISGVDGAARSRDDTICVEILKALEDILKEVTEKVKTYVDKFIAHNATLESRNANGYEPNEVTYGELYKLHLKLVDVATFLSTYVLGDNIGGVFPVTTFNQFEYLDVPLVDESGLSELKSNWKQFAKLCNDRSYGLSVNELLPPHKDKTEGDSV